MFSRKPVEPLAATIGKNTLAYIQNREAKIANFIPTVYEKVVEKITNASNTTPTLNLTVEVVKMFAEDGDKLFAQFAGKYPTLPLTNVEFDAIATKVADKLREQKFVIEQVTKPAEDGKVVIDLNISWELPKKEEPAPVAPAAPVEEKKN